MNGELWLLGSDIAHSPSPAMHNAALEHLGLHPCYGLHPCDADSLHGVLDLAERGCRGINLTLPHKTRAAERYAAQMDETALRIGAINTVVFENKRAVRALNTDVDGLLSAWRRGALHVEGRRVVVFGAGGAARAAVYALSLANAGGVSIRARRREAAEELRRLAAQEGLPADCGEGPGGDMLIVASPVVPDIPQLLEEALCGSGVVHDLRYGQKTHGLRNHALRHGHFYLDGRSMLLGQAVSALRAFLGKPVSREAEAAMARALAQFVQ